MNQDDKDRDFTVGDGSNRIEPDEHETLHKKVGDDEVERGLPQNLSSKKKTNVGKVFVFGGIVLAVLLIVITMMGLSGRGGQPEDTTPKELDMVKNSRPKNFALEQAELTPPPPPPAPVVIPPAQEPNVATAVPGQVNSGTVQPKEQEPVDRRLTGPVTIDFSGGKGDSSAQAGQVSRTESSTASGFASKLRPTKTEPTVAMKRADLTYLLKKGTSIACTLNTMIVTTQPGITRCMVTKDVYSANGRVLLIERGSEVIGEQTAALVQGQARVYVLWSTIETPAGVSVTVNSPSADSLGASGQEAQVDNHFWQRFGGAIMLSLIKDGIRMADSSSRNRGGVTFDSSSDSAEDMATEALKNTINIPPTGYVNQGTLVNVMVARDVDFRSVYELVQPYFYSSSTK
ncbi:Bacterial conjugation TrbI-like protein (plasmid) [Advenella kashmirensis WT001]|uniref:Bacterial conjugation TrbI-like protein n=2 Tax=Advenella TaxID=290425 RepID=I3UHZ3_ADVKW|nr:type IV secretion system protein VirB10 [Advenella kashmirensis]ACD43636.1 TagB10 [Advenella kashmirensis]AFK64631.1 Bacterial conjugation TrbI-like protein [Advenella kashmirensis WT001]